MAEYGLNKINFPQNNPTLDTCEQKNQPHSKSPNPTSPPGLSNLFPLKGFQANKHYFCVWTTAVGVSCKHALNKRGLGKLIFITHTKKPDKQGNFLF